MLTRAPAGRFEAWACQAAPPPVSAPADTPPLCESPSLAAPLRCPAGTCARWNFTATLTPGRGCRYCSCLFHSEAASPPEMPECRTGYEMQWKGSRHVSRDAGGWQGKLVQDRQPLTSLRRRGSTSLRTHTYREVTNTPVLRGGSSAGFQARASALGQRDSVTRGGARAGRVALVSDHGPGDSLGSFLRAHVPGPAPRLCLRVPGAGTGVGVRGTSICNKFPGDSEEPERKRSRRGSGG